MNNNKDVEIDKYESLVEIAKAMSKVIDEYPDSPATYRLATGLVAEGLHRVRAIHSGLISVEANKREAKWCKEHYYGRQASGEKIVEQIKKGKSDAFILRLVKSRSRVHYTTPQENISLRNYSHLHWREGYRQAGITLVKFYNKSSQDFKDQWKELYGE